MTVRTLTTCDAVGCHAIALNHRGLLPDGWLGWDRKGAMLQFCSEKCLEDTLGNVLPPMTPGARKAVEEAKRT